MVTASSIAFRFDWVDRCITDLAERVRHWCPGVYAGGLYADFVDAHTALVHLDPVQVAYAGERLERPVEPWAAMPAKDSRAMLVRINAVLTRPAVIRAIGNCFVLPLREVH